MYQVEIESIKNDSVNFRGYSGSIHISHFRRISGGFTPRVGEIWVLDNPPIAGNSINFSSRLDQG